MGFVEVKTPVQFKFLSVGDSVTGRLLGISLHPVKGKKTIQYTVQLTNGDKLTFLATWDLAQKINKSMIGCLISAKLIKLDSDKGRDGNPMRIFTVLVDRDDRQQVEEVLPGITDEDIPF